MDILANVNIPAYTLIKRYFKRCPLCWFIFSFPKLVTQFSKFNICTNAYISTIEKNTTVKTSTLQSKPQPLSIPDSWRPISKNNAVAIERIHVTA